MQTTSMSKLTFRADDDLIERVEAMDASKSEIMREALRAYLDGVRAEEPAEPRARTLDALVAERVDAMIEERLGGGGRDVNVNISLDGVRETDVGRAAEPESDPGVLREAEPTDDASAQCAQCGEPVADDHVYCPNCGEKRSRRVFCECGDEIRTDWSFCPSCGRRTPAADVLDRS